MELFGIRRQDVVLATVSKGNDDVVETISDRTLIEGLNAPQDRCVHAWVVAAEHWGYGSGSRRLGHVGIRNGPHQVSAGLLSPQRFELLDQRKILGSDPLHEPISRSHEALPR